MGSAILGVSTGSKSGVGTTVARVAAGADAPGGGVEGESGRGLMVITNQTIARIAARCSHHLVRAGADAELSTPLMFTLQGDPELPYCDAVTSFFVVAAEVFASGSRRVSPTRSTRPVSFRSLGAEGVCVPDSSRVSPGPIGWPN